MRQNIIGGFKQCESFVIFLLFSAYLDFVIVVCTAIFVGSDSGVAVTAGSADSVNVIVTVEYNICGFVTSVFTYYISTV